MKILGYEIKPIHALYTGVVALTAFAAGCDSTPARKANLQDYLNSSRGQIIKTSEDKKFTPEEMKDIGETYCILHDFQQRGVKDEKQNAELEKTLEVLGKVINTYMEKGSASHEDFAYVDAVEEGTLVNNGGNVPMPARLPAEARKKLYATVRDKAEGLRRLKTEWVNVQTSDGKNIDNTAWNQFYRAIKKDLFRELLDATVQDRFGGGSVPGERESQWTLEDHEQFFGKGKTEKNRGRETRMGLVSEFELPVDKDLEEVIKAFTAEKKEETKPAKPAETKPAKPAETKPAGSKKAK